MRALRQPGPGRPYIGTARPRRVVGRPGCAPTDRGADVIRVQMPQHRSGDDALGGQDGSDYRYARRNKRPTTLDLKLPEGIAVLKRLVHAGIPLRRNLRGLRGDGGPPRARGLRCAG